MVQDGSPEDLLIDMKDTSELMVDLAYSALLKNDKDIAELVFELEERVNHLEQEIQRRAFESVSEKELGTTQAYIITRLTICVEDIANAAVEMAETVARDMTPPTILRRSVDESDSIIFWTTVNQGSEIAGQTLGESHLQTATGATVLAIKKTDGRWICGPAAYQKMEPGDLLLARGPDESDDRLLELTGNEPPEEDA